MYAGSTARPGTHGHPGRAPCCPFCDHNKPPIEVAKRTHFHNMSQDYAPMACNPMLKNDSRAALHVLCQTGHAHVFPGRSVSDGACLEPACTVSATHVQRVLQPGLARYPQTGGGGSSHARTESRCESRGLRGATQADGV